MTQTVLVVDDKLNVRLLLSDFLTEHGYTVITASNGHEAVQKIKQTEPDIILLDIMMPQMDGYQFISRLRQTSQLPVIMITAKQHENDVVRGFELGADDYIIKPFRMSELLMRLKAVLRRSTQSYSPSQLLQVSALQMDLVNNEVRINDKFINLTPAEFSLLKKLMHSVEHTVTKAALCTYLIENGYSGSESTLKIHIRNIRTKLEPNAAQHLHIESVFGVGYRLRTITL